MYLKTLEIQGFKSFAERTVLEFHRGVTGIVGPNGCGKSNVVDAIRWVLGETSAKALRGGEMADVIFNGTEKRKPLGMAEVTLTLGECDDALRVDFSEVAITRRVFRDGRGEYRINGMLCRLKDIHDLFADTGIGRTAYSIMAQGQIDQILSSKPEERRVVFEEAAGITKFKREKREALRKLEYTEANLLRVGDVLAEQERRMNSLKRQVAKARRYQALAADVRVLDTHLGHKRFVELSAQAGELRTAIGARERREAELGGRIPGREREVAGARHAAQALEAELAGLREQLNEQHGKLAAAEGRMAFNRERRADLEGRIERNRGDIEATGEKLVQQEFVFRAASEALDEVKRRIAGLEEQLAGHERRTAVAQGERERLERALHESRAEANRTQTLIASTQARIESALAQLEGARERARQLVEEQQRLAGAIEVAGSERDRIGAEVAALGAGIRELEAGHQAAQRAFQRARGDLDAAAAAAAEAHRTLAGRASRLDVVRRLVARGEGLDKGTREVLGGLGDPARFAAGIHGPLVGLIEVDSRCARAVEAALGAHLQAVLVEDGALAAAAIAVLTDKRLGEAALLPADFVGAARGSQMLTLPEGAVAWALDRVKSDPRVAGVVERLLEQVLVVPDLATALRLRAAHPGVGFATLAGEWLGAEGIVRGGAAGAGGHSLLEMHHEVRALEVEVAALEEAEAAELDEQAAAARDRLERRRVELSTREGELGLAGREVEGLEAKLAHVAWERGELDGRERAAADNRRALEGELAAARARLEELEGAQRRQQDELGAVLRNERELTEGLQELRMALAVERRSREAAEEQQHPMEARIRELRELRGRCEAEIAGFEERIAAAVAEDGQLALECEGSRARAAELGRQLEEVAASRPGLEAAIAEAERVLDELRREIARAGEARGRDEVELTKHELRLENLVETTRERHQVELDSFEPDAHALLACIRAQQKAAARRAARAAAAEGAEGADAGEGPEGAEAGELPEAVGQPLPGEVEGEPDWDFVEREAAELRRRLEAMGPVNVDAIEEFEELEERHRFLRGQHDDLVRAKAELLDVIGRIDVETRRRFAETFAQVRENFRRMFRELFGADGKADLLLVDESDPLESGIEVIAKPPGKKLQSITLLSGGERSMTAVALLFSIYLIKPSPFCVLDELDAPLDEANIGRFLRVLDGFIENSQFIIVTHSKRTMARVDVMYGVTMQEFGVSKPVGMRLTQATNGNGNGNGNGGGNGNGNGNGDGNGGRPAGLAGLAGLGAG